MDEPDENQNSPESDMEMEDEFTNQADELHICKGYVQAEALALNQLTIKRAHEAGVGESMLKLSVDVLSGIEQLGMKENNYEDMAKIIEIVQEATSTLQKRYHAPNIKIGSFVTPDTGASNTVYITEYGIILEAIDQINGIEVRKTDPAEIWRYLYEPLKVVENIISTFIAVAEKHKAIKDDWIRSFQRIRGL